MKRILLFMLVALTATAGKAQNFGMQNQSNKALSMKMQPMTNVKAIMPNNISMSEAKFKNMSDVLTNVKKAASQSDLYGNYIEDDFHEIHECGAATLADSVYVYTDTITGATTSYNVVKLSFGEGYVNNVIGVYDATAGTITIPAGQDCYEYTEYGKMALVGIKNITESGFYWDVDDEGYFNDLVLEVNEDGSLSLQNEGYVIYMYEYEEEDSKVWTYFIGANFYAVNATENYYFTSVSNSSWTPVEAKTNIVAVEDYGTSVNIYNMANMNGCIAVDINDDLTVSIAAKQPTGEITSTYSDLGFGDYIMLIGTSWNQDSIAAGIADYDIDEDAKVTGKLSGNTIALNGNDLTLDENNYYTVFYFCSQSPTTGDYAGYRLYRGCVLNYSITLNNGNFTAGINEVTASRENTIRNTKTYNLMGQRVNRDTAKGLLIYGGKKYIKK